MVALGLVEVAILPDDNRGEYDDTIDPFPVHDRPWGDDGPRTVKQYIEVTEGERFQFYLALNRGFNFDDCNALIYELYVNGDRKEGSFVDQDTYDRDDEEVGRGRWAACFAGARTDEDDALGMHRLKCKSLQDSRLDHL